VADSIAGGAGKGNSCCARQPSRRDSARSRNWVVTVDNDDGARWPVGGLPTLRVSLQFLWRSLPACCRDVSWQWRFLVPTEDHLARRSNCRAGTPRAKKPNAEEDQGRGPQSQGSQLSATDVHQTVKLRRFPRRQIVMGSSPSVMLGRSTTIRSLSTLPTSGDIPRNDPRLTTQPRCA